MTASGWLLPFTPLLWQDSCELELTSENFSKLFPAPQDPDTVSVVNRRKSVWIGARSPVDIACRQSRKVFPEH